MTASAKAVLPHPLQALSPNQVVAAALDATDPTYLASCFEQRNPGPKALGSHFLHAQTVESLKALHWEPYAHRDIQAPAIGYRAEIAGFTGITTLSEVERLKPDAEIILQDGHVTKDHPEGCGYVSPTVKGEEFRLGVFHTTLLIGPKKGEPNTYIVWTFFPGDPVQPSSVKSEGQHGKIITIAEARALGFEYVKIFL